MGLEALDAKIAFLAALGRITDDVMPDVANDVRAELVRTSSSGEDPYGQAWQPKKDGGTPLVTAAQHIRVAPIGRRVFCRVTGHVAKHHRGRARGGVVRHVLPTGALPPAMAQKIKATVIGRFRALKAADHG